MAFKLIMGGLAFVALAAFVPSFIISTVIEFPFLTFTPEFGDSNLSVLLWLTLLFLNGVVWTWAGMKILSAKENKMKIFSAQENKLRINNPLKIGLTCLGLILVLVIVIKMMPTPPGAFFTTYDVFYVLLLFPLLGIGLPLLVLGIMRNFAKNEQAIPASPQEHKLSKVYFFLAVLVIVVPVALFVLFLMKEFYLI